MSSIDRHTPEAEADLREFMDYIHGCRATRQNAKVLNFGQLYGVNSGGLSTGRISTKNPNVANLPRKASPAPGFAAFTLLNAVAGLTPHPDLRCNYAALEDATMRHMIGTTSTAQLDRYVEDYFNVVRREGETDDELRTRCRSVMVSTGMDEYSDEDFLADMILAKYLRRREKKRKRRTRQRKKKRRGWI